VLFLTLSTNRPYFREVFAISPDMLRYPFVPDEFMLHPTFPKISGDWVQKVVITIRANQNITDGGYVIPFIVTAPDSKTSQRFYQEMQNVNQSYYSCPDDELCDNDIVELRKRVYVEAGQFSGSEFFKIILNAD